MQITDEMVLAARQADQRYRVEGTPEGDRFWGPPYKVDGPWFVIDTHDADWSVGYQGRLVSEHTSHKEAQDAHMRLVLEAALGKEN